MAYALEAVRWTDDHKVASVRWHSFEYVDGELKKGPSVLTDIANVAKAAKKGHDVYLCYHGAVGRRIDVIALPDGRKTLVDLPIGDQDQALDDLPRIWRAVAVIGFIVKCLPGCMLSAVANLARQKRRGSGWM